MAAEWPKSLSFSDRLAATKKISTAYKECHLSCTEGEASKHAKACEETARKNAASEREYHELIAKAVQELLDQKSAPSGGGSLPDDVPNVDAPTSGVVIGRYIHAQHYRDGLFSEVFKAVIPEAENRPGQSSVIALKVTSPEAEGPPHDSRREARLLEATKHEHIIALLETFQQPGGRFVLAFPFLPYDLDTLLHQRLLTDESRRSILKDLFSALAYLHRLQIIHRDIKPSNILLASPFSPAYLSDFGIAWSPLDSASESPDEKILDVGTTSYRPPELLFGNQKYGAKLDMWAAGCTAAQVVCLGVTTLFDSGDLGSELALIKSVFETLGTPDLDVWPEAADFPDWGKMNFKQYPGKSWQEILPAADADAVDLVSNLVVFESGRRLSAEAALEHAYLQAAD